MIQKKDITAIVLAGGQSSRMGSDKGLLDLNGSTFMSRIIKAVKPLVNDIIIVSDSADYDIFGLKRVEDIVKDVGPLGGLFSGLFYSETEINLALSCDVPLINRAVLKYLFEGFDTERDVIQLRCGGKTMPLIAIYKKNCMHHFLNVLKTGERRVMIAVDQLPAKTIELAPNLSKYVRNINTIDELKEIRHELEH